MWDSFRWELYFLHLLQEPIAAISKANETYPTPQVQSLSTALQAVLKWVVIPIVNGELLHFPFVPLMCSLKLHLTTMFVLWPKYYVTFFAVHSFICSHSCEIKWFSDMCNSHLASQFNLERGTHFLHLETWSLKTPSYRLWRSEMNYFKKTKIWKEI